MRSVLLLGIVIVLAACGRVERTPPGSIPADVKRVVLEVVARDSRCEPAVLAVDREGRAVVLTFQVTSVGKSHMFLIPGLDVRRSVPAGTRVDIPVLVERSGIHEFACTSIRWITPLASAGKLAIK